MQNVKRPIYSQKHYEDAAISLLPGVNTFGERIVIAKFLLSLFEPDNPKFDKLKFLKRAKLDEEDLKRYG